jgi:hypothetical protein
MTDNSKALPQTANSLVQLFSFLGMPKEVYKVDRLTQGITHAVQDGCASSNLQYNLENQGLNIRVVQHVDGYWEDRGEQWFGEGVECELLQPGSKTGWVKGRVKLKISLEFHPDDQTSAVSGGENQPSSPLDEIRKLMAEES